MEMMTDMGKEHPASVLRRRGFPAMSRRSWGLHPARGGRRVGSGGVATMKVALDLDGVWEAHEPGWARAARCGVSLSSFRVVQVHLLPPGEVEEHRARRYHHDDGPGPVAPPVGVVARAEGQRGCPERVHASQDYSQPDAHPAPASPDDRPEALLEPLWGFFVSIPTPGFRRMHRRVRHQVLCPRASRARSPPARMPSECPFARFLGLKGPLASSTQNRADRPAWGRHGDAGRLSGTPELTAGRCASAGRVSSAASRIRAVTWR